MRTIQRTATEMPRFFLLHICLRDQRPEITSAPASVNYGESFEVGTSQPNEIGKVSWIRLPSVTHSFDQNQHINFLQFQVAAGRLTVTAPNSPNVCPPGHYMLFIVSRAGVPSMARIIQIQAAVAPDAVLPGQARGGIVDTEPGGLRTRSILAGLRSPSRSGQAAKGTRLWLASPEHVLTGLAACWGGAYEALHRLEGVDLVSPIPNADDSTAEVFLEDERCPHWIEWDEQFRSIVNGRMNCVASRSLCRASSKSGMGNSSWRAVDRGHRSS